jgi:hypothetical protein
MMAHLSVSGVALATLPAMVRAAPARRTFTPGQVWLDTAGRPIQAHGGSIFQIGDTFYWYGENKEKTLGGRGIWHWGVRAYASKDFYNWTDAGLIIPPVTDDPLSPLHPSSQLDRPHILFNKRTGKYVCWVKIMEKDGRQTRTILTADSFTGPYTIVRKGVQLNGMSAGDFDLVVSADDQKGYIYYERVHSELICADLTDDYTNVTGYYSTHFPNGTPPDVREAPAYFRRAGKHYLATSGTTSYHPNPSQIAESETFHGPWTVLGDLHPSDRSRTSFNTQISSVFRHPVKKDLYIALADRWIPNLPRLEGNRFASGEASNDYQNAFRKMFHGRAAEMSPAEQAALNASPDATVLNTSISTYAWLPIRFDGDHPVIEWRDEWSLDEFS